MIKQFVSEYLRFTKKERNGTLLLLALIGILLIIPFLLPLFIKEKKYDPEAFKKDIASLRIQQADTASTYPYKKYEAEEPGYLHSSEKNSAYRPPLKSELFYFDPNSLDEAGWSKLGLRDKTIATIKKYLQKGGKFYRPEDIRKIWGIDEALAARLVPFVQIKQREYAKNEAAAHPAFEKKTYKPVMVDINEADTAAWIALPGIGSKLASRIVSFRDKLGGFYSIDQVGETFGLPDSTFKKIKDRLVLSGNAVKQININTASLDELKVHPYIRYSIANAIVQYRNQHGHFSAVTDLKKIMILTEEVFNRLLPYAKT